MLHSISRWRRIKDRTGALVAAACGIGIIAALALMLGYLTWEAATLSLPSDMKPLGEWKPVTEQGRDQRQLWIGHRGGKALEVSASGARFVDIISGESEVLGSWPERLRPGLVLRNSASTGAGDLGLALDKDGQVLLFQPGFRMRWQEGTDDYHSGEMHPELAFPLGVEPLSAPLPQLPDLARFEVDERSLRLLASVGNRIYLLRWALRASPFGDGMRVGAAQMLNWQTVSAPQEIFLGANGLVYLLGGDGRLDLLRPEFGRGGEAKVLETRRLLGSGTSLSTASLLLGGRSLVVADDRGGLALWRYTRSGEDQGARLRHIRDYQSADSRSASSRVVTLRPEPQRKGFFAFDAGGGVRLYYMGESAPEYQRTLLPDEPVHSAWLGPAGRQLLVVAGKLQGYWHSSSEYSDVSAALLWARQWYEGYGGPDWVWQSTSADTDFEPKFSLMPLVVGTLKGAFYAMLFAVPVALLAAIYVARFMAPAARAIAKPSIEILAALPTVILGFLGALWLAPLVAKQLSGVLLGIALLPLSLLLFAALLQVLPAHLRRLIPEGWEFVPALPLCVLVFAACVASAPVLDASLFDGDFIIWMDDTLGLVYEQRNAAIVGMAMSFAVIPTIFSIAEDALFQAPKSLLEGGLALGATTWQAVVLIIVPTASPGIFSAIMIGLGRAVGETMVVVMATGNTPLMDWLPFTGMRTLSANIAVEMPEAEIGSSHFHLLFLSAMLLFLMTFAANSGAEYIRHRLRMRYANL